MHRPHDGQVLPLVAVAVVGAGFLGYGVARLGSEAVAGAMAQTAADAAALAGATDGEHDAAAAAVGNRGQLVVLRRKPDGRVCVVVRRGPAEARACARRAPGDGVRQGRAG
jgi:hypothetical protein